VELRGVSCERDDRLLFQGLNVRVGQGEIWQLEGANGTGKTTLLRAICGLFGDYEGEILYRGQCIKRNRMLFNTDKLFIGHKTGVKPALTAEENLAWLAGQVRRASREQIHQALLEVGLGGFEDVPAYALSAGQQRRIALARLYVENVSLWILDEPFTAIDVQGVALLETAMSSFIAAGGTILLTSHHALETLPVNRLNLGFFTQPSHSSTAIAARANLIDE